MYEYERITKKARIIFCRQVSWQCCPLPLGTFTNHSLLSWTDSVPTKPSQFPETIPMKNVMVFLNSFQSSCHFSMTNYQEQLTNVKFIVKEYSSRNNITAWRNFSKRRCRSCKWFVRFRIGRISLNELTPTNEPFLNVQSAIILRLKMRSFIMFDPRRIIMFEPRIGGSN